jgi:hypothetical protein
MVGQIFENPELQYFKRGVEQIFSYGIILHPVEKYFQNTIDIYPYIM